MSLNEKVGLFSTLIGLGVYDINIKNIYIYKDSIFANNGKVDYQDSLVTILDASVSDKEWDDKDEFVESEELINMQRELIILALENGANINAITNRYSKAVGNHYDLLLNYPTNPLEINKFLSIVLSYSVTSYDRAAGKSLPDQSKVKKQGNLLKIALDRGADINPINVGFEVIENHYDLLVNHPTNPLEINKFLSIVLSISLIIYDSTSGKFLPDQAKVKKQGNLLKIALDRGADINPINVGFEVIENHYDLLVNHPTNPLEINKFLSIVLSCSVTSYDRTSGKFLPDQAKVKKQGELLKVALDRGANINAINFGFEVIENHYDLLVNHPTNPLEINKFLSIVLSCSVTTYDSTSGEHLPDQAKVKTQGELIKLALDKGGNINDADAGFEVIENHYDLLVNHPINPLEINKFLILVLSCSVTSYDRTSGKFLTDQLKIKTQGELLKIALDRGADINASSFRFEVIENHYDLLLNHPTNPLEINKFLNEVLSHSVRIYDSVSSTYLPEQARVIIQGELIKLALDMGANINDAYLSLENLFNHHDLLLNHPTNPLEINKFLTLVLSCSITSYDRAAGKYLPEQASVKKQGELIKLALDRGANINDAYVNLENLFNHHDLLLNHPRNPISLEKFISYLLVNRYTIDENGKYIKQTENTVKIADLLEIVSKIVLENNSLDLKQINSIDILVVRELFDRGTIDDQTILELALKASGYFYRENQSYYDLESVELQKALLEELFKRSVSIESLSFNELNIEDNHISILKILLEQGLDPRALILHGSNKEDALEVLALAIELNIKITPLKLIISLFNDEIKTEVFIEIINNMGYEINYVLTPETVRDEFIAQGAKFKQYFDELTEEVEFEDVVKPLFAEGGTLLHILVKSDKKELVKYVLKNYPCNVNALNNIGQTPLFFAQSPEVAKALIEYEADLSIKDKRGNNWMSNPSLELIEYAVENKYLDANYAERVAHSHFTKGNYEHAAKLYKIGFELNFDPREQIVDSIMNGLLNSIEKNKYQALLNLVHKAGIELPSEFNYLLRSVRDDHSPEEFGFLNGLIHKLAQHYLNLARAYLAKDLGSYEGLDYAFETFDFSGLKLRYPGSKVLARITDEFSAYYQIAGRALNILDNDFALEVLTINGLRPNPLNEDIVVFRGMKVNLSPDDIDSYFKFGHRGFSAGEYQKTLGFNVDQPWNEIGARWEYGGTYSSVEAIWASHFSDGITSSIEAESVLLEIRIPAGAPKICGSWKNEYEVVPSTISGEDIVAIYTLNIYSDKNGKHYYVHNVHRNPYIDSAIMPKFKAYEEIKEDPTAIRNYNSLGCINLPTLTNIKKSALYKDYADFIEHYTSEDFIRDQDKLMQDYFEGRELYREDFSYGLRGECDLRIECCLYPGEL